MQFKLFVLWAGLITALALVACSPTAHAGTAGIPAFAHIYVIVLENKNLDAIVDNPQAPYLNSLIRKFGLATNYTSVTHPSQPNYLALFSGATHNVTDDAVHDIDARNLVDQLEARGKTWRVFAENFPGNCFTGESARNGADGTGEYARKHNPAMSFTNISRVPARCAHISDFAHFDAGAADFALIVPNLCNGMHDCSIAAGDKFLSTFVPKIFAHPAWLGKSVVFVVFDEGDERGEANDRVPLIVISNDVAKNLRVPNAYNHYSLLRTIQDAWDLGCLGESCNAQNLADFFR